MATKVGTKRCIGKCGLEKSTEEFYLRRSGNRENVCKKCKHDMSKAWRANNPDKTRGYKRKYDETHRNAVNAGQQRRRRANPEHFRARDRAYRAADPERVRRQNQKHYSRHGDKVRACSRRYKFEKIYGLTEDDFNRMLEQQDGRCALCRRPFGTASKSEKPHIDHCHDTGVVRGLLCSMCNMGIGCLKDNPDIIRRAADYLEVRREGFQAVLGHQLRIVG